MAYVLFANIPFNFRHFDIDVEHRTGKKRLSLFLIVCTCTSVAAWITAVCILWRRWKNKDQVSALIVMLFFSDLMELSMNPYIVTKLLQDDNCWLTSVTCRMFASLWSGARNYGLYLNAVVVLESVLSIRHPFCSAHVFFPSCSIIFSVIVFICIFLCEFFSFTLLWASSLPLLLAMIGITCIVTCRTPPYTEENSSSTWKQWDKLLGFAILTVFAYMVYIVLCLFPWRFWPLIVMGNCLISLRVISDPLLCVLIYWENLSQTPKTHTGHNSATELTTSQTSNNPNPHSSVI